MRQILPQHPIQERAEHRAGQKNRKNSITTAQQNEHRPRANAGQRPSRTKNEAAQEVARNTPVLRMENDFLSLNGSEMFSFDDLNDSNAGDHRRQDNSIHMEGLEMKHFEYPEPGDCFRLVEGDPQKDADEDVS